MRVSLEVLDYIFSFLVPHRKTLLACSKDPALFPIVERHLYHHVTVLICGFLDSDDSDVFEQEYLSELLSENPRILNYVRILEIQSESASLSEADAEELQFCFDDFAITLRKFPALECVMLTTPRGRAWYWSDGFRAALEDRLSLPTFKELHLVGSDDFPYSLLDHCKNITNLSISGAFEQDQHQFSNSPLPRLRSLTLLTHFTSPSLLAWLKLHVNELQSYKYSLSSLEGQPFSKLLEASSQTLKKFDLDLEDSMYFNEYVFRTGELNEHDLLDPGPAIALLNLDQLTLRTGIHVEYENNQPMSRTSWMSAAIWVVKLVIPTPRRLVLDINIKLSNFSDFSEIDFSPLAILGAFSLSIPRIDLYVHTGIFPSAITRAQLLLSLEDYEDVIKSIKEGVLVIHSEKTAPDDV